MARPVINPDGVAGNLSNKTKHCNIILTGDNLSTNIRKQHVDVWRTDDGTIITVDSAKAVPHNGAWVLVIKSKKVSTLSAASLTTSDEISVTVTNPDTSQVSEETTVDVVYYDEE
jgi:hypothetical protein